MERKHCPICLRHPVAINYYKNGRVHYRTACTSCIHQRRHLQPMVPSWIKSGYKLSTRCDRCGFKFKTREQSNVYYIDGNVNNANWVNLKTICLNCQQEVGDSRWRPSALKPDF